MSRDLSHLLEQFCLFFFLAECQRTLSASHSLFPLTLSLQTYNLYLYPRHLGYSLFKKKSHDMASVGTYIAEWFRQRLSTAVTFQKQFVDDVTEKVKEQKAQFDRHTREAQERAIQLHLDDLEEKYLCCVCGQGGEAREDDEFVYDTYSMVELPPRMTLEAAVREELADVEMTDERIKQHQRELAVRQRTNSRSATLHSVAQTRYSDEDVDVDNFSFDSSSAVSQNSLSNKTNRQHRRTRGKSQGQQRSGSGAGQRGGRHRVASREAKHAQQRKEDAGVDASKGLPVSKTSSMSPMAAARQSRQHTAPGENRPGELAVMDPDMVGPLEVRNTLYKIRHAVLHKEARTRRKAVAVHKDKGLMKIEESEIDMFSHFFQRPVHGYLCNACYTCARRRLDTLTQQIRGILFKAQNPILRRVSSKEIIALSSNDQVSPVLVQSILTVQKRWAGMSEEQRTLLHGAQVASGATQTFTAALSSEECTSWNTQVNGEVLRMGSLSEKCILILREEAKCGACQRRPACFFEQRSVVFLCQFCTSRDRFYRENAVCINDEAMPLNLVHMLQDFADYYLAMHQQRELRGAPQSAIDQAQTDLFPLTEVLRVQEGLFACLSPAATGADTQSGSGGVAVEATYSSKTAKSAATRTAEVPIAAPSTFAATNRVASRVRLPLREQRGLVGRTMVSLFDGVKLESTGLNLFAAPDDAKPAPPVSAPTGAARSPPTSPPALAPAPTDDNPADLFDFAAPATSSCAEPITPATAQPTFSTGQQLNGTVNAGGGQTAEAARPPSGAGPSGSQNPDWDSLF